MREKDPAAERSPEKGEKTRHQVPSADSVPWTDGSMHAETIISQTSR